MKASITRDRKEIENSDCLILPGVGSFPNAINSIKKYELYEVVQKFVASGKRLVGICLGAQLLLSKSYEFSEVDGFGFIEGHVEPIRKFSLSNKLKVPHIGWNNFELKLLKSPTSLFDDLVHQYFYFVHSYIMCPRNHSEVIGETKFEDVKFASIIRKENIIGVQFHPERSGPSGIKFFQNLKSNIQSEH